MNHAWAYLGRDGRALGTVKRIDRPDGKTFVQYRADGKPGGFGHPLYGLPRLQDPKRSVHLFEGEKCADAGYAAGLIALSTCGGAGSAHLADLSPLEGFELVILFPDNDKPGRQRWAPALIKKLLAFPKPPRVMVFELPKLPPKGDLVDWMQERLPGWDGFDLVTATQPLCEQLRDVIRANLTPAHEWVTHAIEVLEGGSQWNTPDALPSLFSPVAKLDPELLPEKWRAWVTAGAENLSAPPDFIAVAAMVCAGSLIGRKVGIHPKQFERWVNVPNLWGAIIGEPSAKKTPSIKYAMAPLRKLQRLAMEQHQEGLVQYQRDLTLSGAQIEQYKLDLKTAVKAGEKQRAEQLAHDIVEMEEQAKAPKPRQYFTNDSTIEKLAVLLTENPNGLLQERDELMGFLRGMDRNGHEQDRPFYLETWDGDGAYVVNRMGREAVHCQGMCLSVFGGTQPGPLTEYIADSLSGGVRDDGMLQRFQLAVWPDPLHAWAYNDKLVDSTIYSAAESVFQHLDQLTPEQVGATIPEDGIPYLRFDDAAQHLFIDWITQLNRGRIPGEHPAMQAHLTKFESLMPSLALILHLADGHTGPIGAEAAAKAADWCEYLESHARRIYSSEVQQGARAAHLLAAKIEGGQVEDGWPTWKISNAGWSGLDKEGADLALATLEQCGWLKVERLATGGKPAQLVRLNPYLEIGRNG